MLGKGINISFKNFKSVLTMLVFKNLKTASYPLSVLTNWVLFCIFIKILKIKLKLRLNDYLFI
jgi:hypothetical protein